MKVCVAFRLAAMLVSLVLVGCGASRPPNVVIVTFDTTRADRLGPYGYGLAHTPTLDRLAREGMVFDDALTTAPITMVAHSSLMTGLLPPAHGVRDNGAFVLNQDAQTLAERFREAGYETRAFVSAVVLGRRYQLDQGFDSYDDDLWGGKDPALFMIRDRPAAQTIDRVLDWWNGRDRTARAQPFFLWVHLFDPHEPHTPPAWTRTLAPTSYDQEIASADRELGRLVEALRESGQLDDTVFLMTADHGESLGEHDEQTHAIFVYQSTVHVPLIVRYPAAFAAGTRYPGPVSLVDVAPTLEALAGLPAQMRTQGRNLMPVLASGQRPDAPQYSESKLSELGFGMAPLHAIRSGGYSFIRAPRPELYRLADDPQELHNLYGEPDLVVLGDRLDLELDALMQASEDMALGSKANPMSSETIQMLQSLGYLQGAADREAVSGMDPKDGIQVYNQLADARHLAQVGKWAEAATALEAILADNPAHFSARSVLALVRFRQQRLDDAEHEYRLLLAQDPSQFRIYGMLGQVAMARGDLDSAEAYARNALEVAPGFVEAMGQLGLIALVRGDPRSAEDWYEQALALDPTLPLLQRRWGDLLFERGDYAAALDAYREVLKRDDQDARALLQAGTSARRAGQLDLAERYLRQAAGRDHSGWIPHYNLGCLLVQLGQADAALQELERAINAGMVDPSLLDRDPDWDEVREQPRFLALRERAGKAELPEAAAD